MADLEHLEILKHGVEVWNRWRTRNRSVEPDLSSANLSGNDLTRIDLIRAELDRADLSSAKLAEADLRRAGFYKADVRGTDLTCADLSRAYCSRANFSEANFRQAKLEETCLVEACLSKADLSDAHLRWAMLDSADLSYANLTNADLRSANLSDASLGHTDLTGANLGGAYLGGADLSDADLIDADLKEADLGGADVRANLSGSDLRRANLSGANLSHTDLSDTLLHGAIIAGADLSESRVTLDLVCIGEALDALGNESFKDVSWKRVFVGPPEDFNPSSYRESDQFWITRKDDESLLERIHKYVADNLGIADDITIEFSQAVWRELHLVEMGLREALGEGRFAVQKADDRLAVTFESPDDLQRGLEAIVVQMAALEAIEPLRVQSMILRPPEGGVVILGPAELGLSDIAARLEKLENAVVAHLPAEADLAEEVVVNIADKIPGLNLLTPVIARIYRRAMEYFKLARQDRERAALAAERRELSAGGGQDDDSYC